MFKIAHRSRTTDDLIPHPVAFWIIFPIAIALLTLVLAITHPSVTINTEADQIMTITAP